MSTGEPSSSNSELEIRYENVVLIRPDVDRGGSFLVSCVQQDGTALDAPYKLSTFSASEVPESLKTLVVDQCPAHLRSSPNHRVDVVVSTKSGTRLALACWEDVVKPLLEAVQGLGDGDGDGKQRGYEVVVTQNARSVRDFARATYEAADDVTIVLLSGDGGIVDLLNESESGKQLRPPSVALLPLGTGNALFHSLHKPRYSKGTPTAPLVHGLRTLFGGSPNPLPIFRASFSPGATLVHVPDHLDGEELPHRRPEHVDHLFGAIVASHGFHASIVWESDTPAYRAHGARRFGMVAEQLLRENHAYKATVSTSRPQEDAVLRPLDGSEFSYVLATMVSNLEKEFTISPASLPLDGKLRLVHFRHLGPDGGAKTMEIMRAAYNQGAHVQVDEVSYDEIEEVKVEIHEDDGRWRKVCVDGTIVEVEKGGWMHVTKELDSRLRIIN